MILIILLLLFLPIISNGIEQPNGQQTEEKTFEKSRQQIMKGKEASPSNGVENVDKNVPKEIKGKIDKFDGILGQENGRAIQEGKSPIGIKAQKQIDPPPPLNTNLVPIEGRVAGGKIIQNGGKKKGRRHKKLKKVNGILSTPSLNANLVPIEGEAGGKIIQNDGKKKGRRHKKLQKINGILPFDPTLVPIEGQKSDQNINDNGINGDEQKKKTKKEKKRSKKGKGKNKKRIRIKETDENEK